VPVHIEEVNSEIVYSEGDSPLSAEQTEALVGMILERLRESQDRAASIDAATAVRREVTPVSRLTK